MEPLTFFELNVSQAAINLGATSGFRSTATEVVDWCDNENPPSNEALNAEVNRLKEVNAQVAANTIHLAYLASTDWYITRHAETAEAVPEAITLARATARAAIV